MWLSLSHIIKATPKAPYVRLGCDSNDAPTSLAAVKPGVAMELLQDHGAAAAQLLAAISNVMHISNICICTSTTFGCLMIDVEYVE